MSPPPTVLVPRDILGSASHVAWANLKNTTRKNTTCTPKARSLINQEDKEELCSINQ